MDKEQYYKENGITTIREHWISLDRCPSCQSMRTFHSEWMMNEELQDKSAVNAYKISTLSTQPGEAVERVFSKEDLCLECGHTWVMYVEVIKIENTNG